MLTDLLISVAADQLQGAAIDKLGAQSDAGVAREGEGQTYVLRYSNALRMLAVFSLVAALGFPAILLAFIPFEPGDGVYLALLAAGFGSAALYFWIESRFVAHRMTRAFLVRKSPWRKSAVLRWSELTRIEFTPNNGFKLTARDGQTLRLSVYMNGLGTFARMALEQMPPEVLLESNAMHALNGYAHRATTMPWYLGVA